MIASYAPCKRTELAVNPAAKPACCDWAVIWLGRPATAATRARTCARHLRGRTVHEYPPVARNLKPAGGQVFSMEQVVNMSVAATRERNRLMRRGGPVAGCLPGDCWHTTPHENWRAAPRRLAIAQ